MPKSNCYIALLRGVNVSGQKKILMKDLMVLFETLGYTKVRTYIQSGNVVFNATGHSDLQKQIHNKIKEVYGWEVPIIILSVEELAKILDTCPWPEEQQLKSYYGLLMSEPDTEHIAKLDTYSFQGESYKIEGRCVYLYYELGAGKAKLSTNFLERILKVSCTTRNHRTLTKLLAMAND